MKKCAAIWIAFLAVVTSAGCGGNEVATRRSVRVAAAADLKFALEEVILEFRKNSPDVSVDVAYGSSGNFFAQLSSKAPFDLYLSADMDYPRKLVELGHASKESEFLYAIGRMVVWTPSSSKLDVEKLGMKALTDPAVRKIAIANPRHAPYGRAAEAAMKKLGVYEQIQGKLVMGENVAQTAQFVESGAADVGIIAMSLALAPTVKNKGRFWEVPLESFPTLEQGGVILDWAVDLDAAKSLRGFLIGPEGRAILNRFGFILPED